MMFTSLMFSFVVNIMVDKSFVIGHQRYKLIIVLYLKRKALTFLLLNTLVSDQSLTNVYIPVFQYTFNPLNPELNPICYLLALLGAHHFLHVSRIRVKLLTIILLMSYIYIYGAPILDVSRSHTTTQHSR